MKYSMSRYIVRLSLMVAIVFYSNISIAERIKDITSISGIRSNPLIGYGLVVGLDGSGDQTNQTPFTTESFLNMLMVVEELYLTYVLSLHLLF
jgi:flagellar basal body P-ring protein FlgI